MKYIIVGLTYEYSVGYTGRYETETAEDAIAEFIYNSDIWVNNWNEGGIICLTDTEYLSPSYGLMDVEYVVEWVNMEKRYGKNWKRECLEHLGWEEADIIDALGEAEAA